MQRTTQRISLVQWHRVAKVVDGITVDIRWPLYLANFRWFR